MNQRTQSLTIPAYAHPIHRGVDGTRSGRRVEGPRTLARTQGLTAAGLAYAAATTKPAPTFTAAEFLAVAR